MKWIPYSRETQTPFDWQKELEVDSAHELMGSRDCFDRRCVARNKSSARLKKTYALSF